MSVTERGHLSIGEVLSLLQTEFPDVTISKIRFLESQGLIDPERTPSGYRKFYEADIDRLRWILMQQRDHFLPLKVIKDRLDDAAALELPIEGLNRPSATATADTVESGVATSNGALRTAEAVEDTPSDEIPADEIPADEIPAEAGDAAADTDAERDDDAVPAGVGAGATRLVGTGGSRAPLFNAFSGSSNQTRPLMAAARPERSSTGDRSEAATGPEAATAAAGGDGASSAGPTVTATGGTAPPSTTADGGDGPSGTRAGSAGSGAGPVFGSSDAVAATAAQPSSTAAASDERDDVPDERDARTDRGRPSAASAAVAPSNDDANRETARRRAGRGRRSATQDVSAVSFTAEELASAVGLDPAGIAELERYGLISPRQLSQGPRYGDDALLVARLAARFAAYGIEARHLRMFRVAVEREHALYEQVISPLSRTRGDSGEVRAAEIWSDLDQLGADFRDALFHRGPL